MDSDLLLVIGLVLVVLAVPAIISAFSDNRPPRVGAVLIILGAGLVALAVMQRPGDLSLGDIPDAFTRVIGRYLR